MATEREMLNMLHFVPASGTFIILSKVNISSKKLLVFKNVTSAKFPLHVFTRAGHATIL